MSNKYSVFRRIYTRRPPELNRAQAIAAIIQQKGREPPPAPSASVFTDADGAVFLDKDNKVLLAR